MLDEPSEKKKETRMYLRKKNHEWIQLSFLLYGLNYVIGLSYIYIYIYYDNQHALMKKTWKFKKFNKNLQKIEIVLFYRQKNWG